jgi:hypothetical protein
MRFRVGFAALVVAGCNGAGGPNTVVLPLTLSTDELHLTSPIGVTATATITATNPNAFRLGTDVGLGDFTSSEFAIQDTDCLDGIAPGASCTTTVAFTPKQLGDTMATLELGGNWIPIDGIAQVALTISPTTQNFQTMYSDVDSDPFAFTIQNTTAVEQHPTTTLRNTLNYDGFHITSSTCADIPALGSCAITVVMMGGLDGIGRAAMLDVDGADASLTGTVSTISTPRLSVAAGTGQVIGVELHAPPYDLLLEIYNGTHTDLPNIDFAITGADAAAFELGSNGCAAPVADGAGCWIDVRARSTGSDISATLTAQTPNVVALTIPLSVGYQDDGPPIAVAPSGIVMFASDQAIPFTISDPSPSPRFIDTVTVAAPYQISNDACHARQVTNVSPCTFTVERVGSSAGDPNQVLTIGWNEGQQTTVTLAPAD